MYAWRYYWITSRNNNQFCCCWCINYLFIDLCESESINDVLHLNFDSIDCVFCVMRTHASLRNFWRHAQAHVCGYHVMWKEFLPQSHWHVCMVRVSMCVVTVFIFLINWSWAIANSIRQTISFKINVMHVIVWSSTHTRHRWRSDQRKQCKFTMSNAHHSHAIDAGVKTKMTILLRVYTALVVR